MHKGEIVLGLAAVTLVASALTSIGAITSLDVVQSIGGTGGDSTSLGSLVPDINHTCESDFPDGDYPSGEIELSEDKDVKLENDIVNLTDDGSEVTHYRLKCEIDESSSAATWINVTSQYVLKKEGGKYAIQ